MKGLSKNQELAITSAQTEQGKINAAAAAMVERPLDLIKHILIRHEQAVIEVMREQQQRISELEKALRGYHDNSIREDWPADVYDKAAALLGEQ